MARRKLQIRHKTHENFQLQLKEVKRIRKGNSPTYMRGFCIFWAERITTRKSIGMFPIYTARRVEPLLLFDLTHANHLVPDTTEKLTDGEVLGMRARQLKQ